MPQTCAYCPIADPETEIVLERDLVLFTRTPKYQGVLKHSGIIIPRAHRETAFDLTEQEWRATFELLREVKAWLDRTVSPAGYNLGWNCGPVAGQEVMHAHLHVIPRFAEEPLAGQGIRALLKSKANEW